MNRPARKLKHLEDKLAAKASRRRIGRKSRTWKKAVETYKPLVAAETTEA